MMESSVNSTSCAFIPVYCYYDQIRGEVKTPILIAGENNLLSAIVLQIDSSIFTSEELKDQFVAAYYSRMCLSSDGGKSLDSYDIYPQLVSILHADNEEISVYACELYENTEPYFKKGGVVAQLVTYKKGVDELIQGGALEPLTEKLLMALAEHEYITLENKDIGISSVEFF